MIKVQDYITSTINHINKHNHEYEIKRSFKDLFTFYSLLNKEDQNIFKQNINIYITKLNKKEIKIFKMIFTKNIFD